LVLVGDGEIKNRVVDGVEDPTADSALSDGPRWIVGGGSDALMCGRRPNFPHRDLKNEAHLVKLGFFISRTTGM
jgi:hypothetical protein